MSGTLNFDGGLTAAYQCKDLPATVQWYREKLGFDHLYTLDEMAWCEMKSPVPGVNVGFSQVESPKVEGGPTLTWGVRDIDAARRTLENQGVRFDGETRVIPEMVKLAGFYDPDGNHLMLYQDLKKE